MKEIRCIRCNKLLGKVSTKDNFTIEIKCERCKTVHLYMIEAQEAQG